jgi:YD repeat-containing protein
MSTTLHAGTTFLISDDAGQVASGTEGLYFQDARFLSGLELFVDGQPPIALSTLQPSPRESVHVATNPELHGITRGTLGIARHRHLAEDALTEGIEIHNYGDSTATFDLDIRVAADFDSIFQVKSSVQSGRHAGHDDVNASSADAGRRWRFGYDANGQRLETEVELSQASSPQGGEGGEGGGSSARLSASVPSRGSWEVQIRVKLSVDGGASSSTGSATAQEAAQHRKQRLRNEAPTLETDHPVLGPAYDRATDDLIALRIKAAEGQGYEIAAGIPWYMTLFGRDSLIASYQTMLHDPSLARGTLQALANLQGTREDRETLEEPGRILHEYRSGIATSVRRKVPRFPYYGTVDATPLFLIVVAEYARVTGDLDFVRGIWENVERALRYLIEHGDRNGDALVEYDPGPDSWLQNLGWKDSKDSVRFRDGSIARPSIALIEVQGYVVEAFRQIAKLMEALGKPGAGPLRDRAGRLASAIAERYWMDDRGYFAEALDGSKRRVDSLTSNPGHLLWARAIDPDRAARIADVLLSPELFSGFGVRTMGSGEGGFNPISYHNGSVWPHDNSIILAGLAHYRLDKHVRTLAEGLLSSLATYPGYRWPELFDGYDRATFPQPIAYPDANSPQAWATGAMMLLVRALLGLEVDATDRALILHPVAIKGASYLRVRGLHLAGARVDIEARFESGTPKVSVGGLPANWTSRHDPTAA